MTCSLQDYWFVSRHTRFLVSAHSAGLDGMELQSYSGLSVGDGLAPHSFRGSVNFCHSMGGSKPLRQVYLSFQAPEAGLSHKFEGDAGIANHAPKHEPPRKPTSSQAMILMETCGEAEFGLPIFLAVMVALAGPKRDGRAVSNQNDVFAGPGNTPGGKIRSCFSFEPHMDSYG